MHSSRMRTVRCSSRVLGGVGCLARGVSAWDTHPPCGQNDRQVSKHYLAATTLRTVKIPSCWFFLLFKFQLLLKANINLSELADTIISQNYIRSVIRVIASFTVDFLNSVLLDCRKHCYLNTYTVIVVRNAFLSFYDVRPRLNAPNGYCLMIIRLENLKYVR